MVWGTPGFTDRLDGASGKSWELTFERRLAPRPGHAENPASSVWLVRDAATGRFYAAKRQSVDADQVDSLRDEAAAWRASSLTSNVLAELVDVFVVRSAPCSVTFLHEFCSRGHVPKRPLSEQAMLTLIADLSEAAAAVVRATHSPHANISYDTVLVDENGRARLAGFGAQRSARLLMPGPAPRPDTDAAAIGALTLELALGRAPRDRAPLDIDALPYSPRVAQLITDLCEASSSGMHPAEAVGRARDLGAVSGDPVVDSRTRDNASIGDASFTAPDVERAVVKLTTGVDAGGAYSAVIVAFKRDPTRAARAIFTTLHNSPIAHDPLCTMRALTMLHNVMLDGPAEVLECTRTNDKFLDWVESTWTQESIAAGNATDDEGDRPPHAAISCFAGGELAFYTSLLRRKARFSMLAGGGFSGSWERTGKTAADGRDFLVTRRRKVVGGMADLAEMASEIGVRFANSTDAETALKHASLRVIVDEVCRAFNAAHALSSETHSVRDAEKLVPGFLRLWESSRALLHAVRDIPSSGADEWADQFGDDGAPDVVKEAEFRIRGAAPPEVADDMPDTGWEETEKMIGEPVEREMTEKELKKEKKRKKKEAEAQAVAEAAAAAEAEAEAKAAEEAEVVNDGADISAADGALVVHGAGDDAAAAVTTMFGDLLKLDGGDTSELRDPAFSLQNGHVPGEVTDAEALADAFGAPPPSSTPALGDDDFDDDDGGYDNFRARQEEARAASSTGKWATRAGYSGALVLHQTVELAPNKPHPAFCQCALCAQAEAQNAASAAELRARQGYSDEGAPGGYKNGYDSAGRDRKDSGYYGGDDAGSYESISYSVDEDQEYNPISRDALSTSREYAPPPPTVLRPECVVIMKKLRTGDKIGEGAFGVVSKGEYKRETVAIKKMNKKMLASKNAMSEFSNEVFIMCAMSHPSLLKCVAASLTPPNVLLVTEFMKRGTLFDVLYKNRIKLTWSMIRKIALQVAEGMVHMQEHGFVHRDLKSANILVDGSYNAKVGDFGLAGPQQPPSAGVSGTYQYMAPEILSGEAHSTKSDVYAYGLILCEMIAGSPPFVGMDPMEAAQQVMNNGARPTLPSHCLRPYASIIQLCWGAAPSSRPDFKRVVELIKTTTK